MTRADHASGPNRFVAFAMATCQMVLWQAAGPIVPLYLTELGASPAALGLIIGIAGFFPLLLGIHIGAMVDLFGTAVVARWSGMTYIAAFVALAFLPDLPGVMTAYGLIGLAQMCLTVSSQTMVAEWSTPETRDRNFGYYGFWVSAGMVIGPIAGGLAADAWGFRTSLLLGVGLALPILCLSLLLRPRPTNNGSLGRALYGAFYSAGGIVQNRAIALTLITSFLIVFAYGLKQSFYPLYLSQIGLSTTLIGVIFAVHSVGSMVTRPFLGWSVARFSYTPVLLCGIAVAALGIIMTPLVTHLVALASAAALVGVAMGITQPLTMSVIAGLVTAELRGLALGLRLTTQRLAVAISPVIFGLVTTAVNIRAAFYVAAVVLIGALVSTARFSRVSGATSLKSPRATPLTAAQDTAVTDRA